MKYIGAARRAAGGLANAPARAAEIGATALRFHKNQASVACRPLTPLKSQRMTLKSPVKSIISRRRKFFPTIVT